MYCVACGTPLAPGLSYCNRCGASLKDRTDTRSGAIVAFLVSITLIGVIGLGIMLGGAMALKREANLSHDLVGMFMLFAFLIVSLTEILLVRQLSRLTGSNEQRRVDAPQHFASPPEIRPAQPRSLAEPISSVTENTTRTLEYSRNEPVK